MKSQTTEYAARVAVSGVPQTLSYYISKELVVAGVGSEVAVEIGSRKAKGWIIEKVPLREAEAELTSKEPTLQQKHEITQLPFFTNNSEPAKKSKGLKPVLEATPAFHRDQLKLFEWMASYYGATLAEIIDNAIPRRSYGRPERYVAITEIAREALRESDELISTLKKRAPKQYELLEELAKLDRAAPVASFTKDKNSKRAILSALEKKNLVQITTSRDPIFSQTIDSSSRHTAFCDTTIPTSLTEHQQHAVAKLTEAINEKKFTPHLLFGVTGSGKTEVYIHAIKETLRQGLSALVVVPEIALTPQLVDRFESRLDLPLGLLHSQVGATDRWSTWEAILNGSLRVAIGARSAIFAPLQDLGLVIIDEEHESSYKQSEGLRYHARDVAVMRGKLAGCPVVLGSATPSFESLHNVRQKRYHLLELPSRATARPVPKIEIVDLSAIKKREMISENLSPPLHDAIAETLERKEQIVILYNRRGFSSYLQCNTCSEVIPCPDCSVALTYHKRRDRLICHYCSHTISPPPYCPECRDPRTSAIETDEAGEPLEKTSTIKKVGALSHRGAGTERVGGELETLFPTARIRRMDRDTVQEKGAYRRILEEMHRGEADILIGTQMIAKGHDLPGVTLVGIIDADVGLHLPDFRSSEKTFQLITQAAGRAGRGKEAGRVLVQTREPNHPTIVGTATGRFRAFARFELEFRKSLQYPPYGRLMRLVVSSPDAQDAYTAAITLRDTLTLFITRKKEAHTTRKEIKLQAIGPAPAAHEKLRGRYRWHILVKSNSAPALSELAAELNQWRRTVRGIKDFRLSIDVDAVDML